MSEKNVKNGVPLTPNDEGFDHEADRAHEAAVNATAQGGEAPAAKAPGKAKSKKSSGAKTTDAKGA